MSTYKNKYIIDTSNLAQGDQTIKLNGKYKYKSQYGDYSSEINWEHAVSWNYIISLLGPHLLMWQNESYLSTLLSKGILIANGRERERINSCEVSDELLQSIKIQLMALGWIDVQQFTTKAQFQALFWILTEAGKAQLLTTASVKTIPQQ